MLEKLSISIKRIGRSYFNFIDQYQRKRSLIRLVVKNLLYLLIYFLRNGITFDTFRQGAYLLKPVHKWCHPLVGRGDLPKGVARWRKGEAELFNGGREFEKSDVIQKFRKMVNFWTIIKKEHLFCICSICKGIWHRIIQTYIYDADFLKHNYQLFCIGS